MRILFLGDLVGEATISVLEKNLSLIKKEFKIDLAFANAENTSNGSGLKHRDYKRLMSLGLQGVTMGNHLFAKDELLNYLNYTNISIPANLDTNFEKYKIYRFNQKTIAVINLLGNVFMNIRNYKIFNPFNVLEELLPKIKTDYIIVDFHAEATSEKYALLHTFKGRVNAILGTHTHVQTADETNLLNTLYITDLGKCGPVNSILGLNTIEIVNRFKSGTFSKANVAKGDIELSGVILDFSNNTIERFRRVYEVKDE